jgi:O-antigen ligase
MTGIFNEQLNSHNQFLQTFLALGLPGILLLLSLFVFPIINSLKTKNYILFCFLVIVFLNFLTESMLETISGVVFFAFFYSLLIANSTRKEFSRNP